MIYGSWRNPFPVQPSANAVTEKFESPLITIGSCGELAIILCDLSTRVVSPLKVWGELPSVTQGNTFTKSSTRNIDTATLNPFFILDIDDFSTSAMNDVQVVNDVST